MSCNFRTVDDNIRIAIELESSGQLDSALFHLDEAVDAHPDHIWARLERGAIRSSLGDQDAAIEDDDHVLVLAPKNQTALFNRALAQGRKGDHAAAIEDLEKIVRIKSPGWDESTRSHLRIIVEPTGNIGLGIAAPEFDIPMGDVAWAFALGYLEMDSANSAYDWLSYCINSNSRVPECYFERGVLLLNHGQNDQGCADLERAGILGNLEARKAWGKFCSGR